LTVSRRAQTIQRAAIPFVGRCWPGDIPAGNFFAKILSATSWLKRAPQPVSSTIARLSQPSVSMGSFPGEETGGLHDSPLEGDGFELPVRERGASGYRPFVAPDAWDGSTRPFLPIDSRAPP